MTIDELISTPRAAPSPRLAEVAPEALLTYLLDGRRDWWRRETIARFWRSGAPAPFVPQLIDLAMNPKHTFEVRVAVLDAVVPSVTGDDRKRLLGWLAGPHQDSTHGLDEAVLLARGRLGDLRAVRELTGLADDPWDHRAKRGREGLRALEDLVGVKAVLNELGFASFDEVARHAKEPGTRAYAVRRVNAAGADLTPFLGDEDSRIARQVFDLTRDRELDVERLRALAGATTSHDRTRAWALLALLRQGESVVGAEDLRLPAHGVPPEVRAAIVATYAPGELDTDPRWLLEKELMPSLEWEPRRDSEEMSVEARDAIERLTEALQARGLTPGLPVSSGNEHQQGDGTYHTLHDGKLQVLVSTLGPFVSAWGDVDREPLVQDAVRATGLTWIDDELGQTVFEGLCVYFFGERAPLPVRDLLFFWQD